MIEYPEIETLPRKVLLVEDEDDIREVVSEMIEDMGYEVTSVSNGMDALEAISSQDLDLVITDVKMQGLDGLSLAKLIRDMSPHLPVALMTAFPPDDLNELIDNRSIDTVLRKPFQLADLQGVVEGLTMKVA